MLSIEQEPIRLPALLSEIDGADGRTVKLAKGRTIVVPRRFVFLWEQAKIGASIYDLSQRLRSRGESSRVFLEVASFLCFLVDSDLIDDVRIVRLADSIRGEYEWPEDFISSYSVSGSISSWPRRAGAAVRGGNQVPMSSRSFDFLTSALVALSVFCVIFLTTLLFDASEVPNFAFGVVFIAGVYWAGIAGRTGIAFFRSLASIIGGDGGELKWKIDLLGPHLLFEAHTVTGSYRRIADFILCFGAATIPLMVNLFGKPIYHGGMVALVGSLFCVALSTHPATRSELTKSLRVWNRTPRVWREDDELREVEMFHRIGGFLSIAIASVFFSEIILGAIKVRPDAAFFRTHFASTAIFAVTFLVLVFTYVEPFLRSDASGVGRNRRRRLWATTAKVLDVAVADREAWNDLPVLRQLTPPLRRQLISAARVVEYGPGHAICRQGDKDRSLYIVLEGKLGIAKSFEGRRRKIVAILSAGAVFGETAFFFASPRTADVVAMEHCRVLEIPYLPAMQTLDLSSSEEFQFRVWLLQALSGNAMLKELPSEAMDTLIFAGTRRRFRAGEAIFTEGAPATTCYFIAQGRASAIQQGRKIAEMGAGDAFGEIALLRAGSHRTASVVADSDLLCMELEIDAFWALLAARLPLGAEIERLALRRLRADEERRAQG